MIRKAGMRLLWPEVKNGWAIEECQNDILKDLMWFCRPLMVATLQGLLPALSVCRWSQSLPRLTSNTEFECLRLSLASPRVRLDPEPSVISSCGNSAGRRAMLQSVSSYSHPMKSLPLLQLRNHLSWFRKIQFDSLHQQTILTLHIYICIWGRTRAL